MSDDADDDTASCETVVKIRGLPYSATKEEIADFFSGCEFRDGLNGIHILMSHKGPHQGKPSGDAFAELLTPEDYAKALECHKKEMGSRYIEVFPCKKEEMEWILSRNAGSGAALSDQSSSFIRLRGLPFGCTKEDIRLFFKGLDIPRDGIVLPLDHADRSTGEAFVKFATGEAAEKAMGKHKEKIGHRYIEIFLSSREEFVDRSMFETYPHNPYSRFGPPAGPFGNPGPFPPKMRFNPMQSARPSPYDRFAGHRPAGFGPVFGYGGMGMENRGPPPPGASRRNQVYGDEFERGYPMPGPTRYGYPPSPPLGAAHPDVGMGRHLVHMRGLPFRATELDVHEFFKPLRPIHVQMLIDNIGRPSGEANVEFASHDEAAKAMNKDKANMDTRYIELFLHSAPPVPGSGSRAHTIAASNMPVFGMRSYPPASPVNEPPGMMPVVHNGTAPAMFGGPGHHRHHHSNLPGIKTDDGYRNRT